MCAIKNLSKTKALETNPIQKKRNFNIYFQLSTNYFKTGYKWLSDFDRFVQCMGSSPGSCGLGRLFVLLSQT